VIQVDKYAVGLKLLLLPISSAKCKLTLDHLINIDSDLIAIKSLKIVKAFLFVLILPWKLRPIGKIWHV
jgi:hypothetical protein